MARPGDVGRVMVCPAPVPSPPRKSPASAYAVVRPCRWLLELPGADHPGEQVRAASAGGARRRRASVAAPTPAARSARPARRGTRLHPPTSRGPVRTSVVDVHGRRHSDTDLLRKGDAALPSRCDRPGQARSGANAASAGSSRSRQHRPADRHVQPLVRAGLPPVPALILSGAWPLAEMVVTVVRQRHVDEFGLFVLVGIVIGLLDGGVLPTRPGPCSSRTRSPPGCWAWSSWPRCRPGRSPFFLARRFATDGSKVQRGLVGRPVAVPDVPPHPARPRCGLGSRPDRRGRGPRRGSPGSSARRRWSWSTTSSPTS